MSTASLACIAVSMVFLISGITVFADFLFKFDMGFFDKSKHNEGKSDDRN